MSRQKATIRVLSTFPAAVLRRFASRRTEALAGAANSALIAGAQTASIVEAIVAGVQCDCADGARLRLCFPRASAKALLFGLTNGDGGHRARVWWDNLPGVARPKFGLLTLNASGKPIQFSVAEKMRPVYSWAELPKAENDIKNLISKADRTGKTCALRAAHKDGSLFIEFTTEMLTVSMADIVDEATDDGTPQ